MFIEYKENTLLGTVQKAMAEAYMPHSNPGESREKCYAVAYSHLVNMTAGVVSEWGGLLSDGCCVFYDTDKKNFYVTGCNDGGGEIDYADKH